MTKLHLIALISLLFGLFTSCEKVVDIDLNKDQERIVIEGEILAGDSTHTVKITKTLNFDQVNSFPEVTTAVVSVIDDLGNSANFSHTGNGIYELTSYPGVVGRTYTMTVSYEGKSYAASSKIPTSVIINNLLLNDFIFGVDTFQTIVAFRTDPAGEQNYYYFDQWINGEKVKQINLQDDQLSDGSIMLQPVAFGIFEAGDTLSFRMANIDKPVYDYFRQLSSNTDGSGATPANPISNFNNGALGYFSARAVDYKTIIIPE